MIVNGFASKAAALRELRSQGFKFTGLLALPESNPKIAKNGKVVGVLSAPLHLAPFDLSGFQVCPQASAGCAAACLHTAGNPVYMEGKDASRKDKTRAYFKARSAFLALLTFEIAAHERKAAKQGMECGVRLNATSDLPWEHRSVIIDGTPVSIMDHFKDVSFYDYTKVTKRALKAAKGGDDWPSNYHLTFSRAEDNDEAVNEVLAAGGNVSIVYSLDLYKEAVFQGEIDGIEVTDGDAHDYRPADPKGCIVALKAKGDARADTSGFVVR